MGDKTVNYLFPGKKFKVEKLIGGGGVGGRDMENLVVSCRFLVIGVGMSRWPVLEF